MGADSLWHWIVVIVIVLLLFGRGKISELMSDVARGIKGFKRTMTETEDAKTNPSSPEPSSGDAELNVQTVEKHAASGDD